MASTDDAEMTTLSLGVFGIGVRLVVAEADASDADFFYGHMRQDVGIADAVLHTVDVELRGEPMGFFASLLGKTGAVKVIRTRDGETAPWNESSFRDWSGAPSPVPPFFSKYARSRLIVSPGAVLRSPGGTTCVVSGVNYVGKTGVALGLLRRDWDLVSEHLLVIDRASGHCLPYLSPMGLRTTHLTDVTLRDRVAALPHRRTMSAVTGQVALVRPFDLFPGQIGPAGPVDKVFALSRTTASGTKLDVVPIDRLRMPTYPAGAPLGRYLPVWATGIERGPGIGADEVADLIARHCRLREEGRGCG